MKIDLSGKTALVTGSTTGIGHAIARGLVAAGADVTVNGRTQAKVDSAIAAIAKAVPGAKVRGVAASVATVEGCNTLVTARRRSISSSTTPESSNRRTSSRRLMRTGAASSKSM